MREIITDDLATGIRKRIQLSFTKNGLVRTMLVEQITNDNTLDQDSGNKPVFLNYYPELSSSTLQVYDAIIMTSADKHKVYQLNTKVMSRIGIPQECDSNSLVENFFYVSHTVELVDFVGISFSENVAYTEGSTISVLLNGESVYTAAISEIRSENYIRLPSIIDLSEYYNSQTKWEVYINDNTNTQACGSFKLYLLVNPDDSVSIDDIRISKGHITDID